MRKPWIAPLVIAAMLVVSALVYSRLPAQVPSHWNIYGEVDGTQSRLAGALFAPTMGLVLWLGLWVLPRIDPRRESYARFRPSFVLIVNAAVLFAGFLHVMTIGAALGWPISMARSIIFGVGLLFAVLGNQLGRVRPNWFVGVRTPWTLANDEVWRRTHRLAARLFVVAGLISVISALVLPETLLSIVALAVIFGAALIPVAYSYILWRRVVVDAA